MLQKQKILKNVLGKTLPKTTLPVLPTVKTGVPPDISKTLPKGSANNGDYHTLPEKRKRLAKMLELRKMSNGRL